MLTHLQWTLAATQKTIGTPTTQKLQTLYNALQTLQNQYPTINPHTIQQILNAHKNLNQPIIDTTETAVTDYLHCLNEEAEKIATTLTTLLNTKPQHPHKETITLEANTTDALNAFLNDCPNATEYGITIHPNTKTYTYTITGQTPGLTTQTTYNGTIAATTPKEAILKALANEFGDKEGDPINALTDTGWTNRELLLEQINTLNDEDTNFDLQTEEHTYTIQVTNN